MKFLRLIIYFPAITLICLLGMVASLAGWDAAENWLRKELEATERRMKS